MVFADAGAQEPVARGEEPGEWCGQCGLTLADGDHGRCARRAELEPPRFCVHCRRRMKVQVTPGAWTATCVAHGTVERSTWA
ncbi:hypothetical protein [Phycicoccus sp.]|uniref:biotin synthase auxiliary protein BsaP n=1 Tax=Phycicoccus sp. TaxID=1902410 RepID=UPI002D046A09|nr:hypothetical protein [Phycicoccus sp.]HMM94212.1 hypothetical protein [Phycicoccus sp.]